MTEMPPAPGAPGSMRVTLTQVAQRAGVSRSAVSFALNGRADQRISAETVARVRQAAEELGYRPNVTAKTLRTGRSGTVALVSDFVSSTSMANSMVHGAIHALHDADTLLYAVDTQGDPALETRLLQNLIDRDIDGILYASMFTRTVTIPPLLRQVPFVLVNCVADLAGVTAVIPDEREAGRRAASAIVDAGHRERIWFVGQFAPGATGGAAWYGWSPLALPERLSGIQAALADVSTSLAGQVAIEDDWDAPGGRAAVAALLSGGARPSALICINDAVALGAYQALHAAGLRVPEDVSVIGFDGSPIAALVEPPLVSVALPHDELGRVAARLLLDPARPPRTHLVEMPLSAGASIAPPSDR